VTDDHLPPDDTEPTTGAPEVIEDDDHNPPPELRAIFLAIEDGHGGFDEAKRAELEQLRDAGWGPG
jgi:hypothetical protein